MVATGNLQQVVSRYSVGKDLQTAREAKGWTLQYVAETVCVKSTYIAAIEKDQFSELPEGPYAIGFVKSYAQLVDLDPEEMARRFKAQAGQTVATKPLRMPEQPLTTETTTPSWRLMGIAVGFIFMVYLVWALLHHNWSEDHSTIELAPDAQLETSEKAVEANHQNAIIAVDSQGQQAASGAGPSQAAVSLPDPSQAGRVYGAGPAKVVLRFIEPTWVQVMVNDQTVISQLFQQGDQYYVPEQNGVQMIAGNAGGVNVVVDGKDLGALGETGKVLRNIPLLPAQIQIWYQENKKQ